MDNKMDVSQLGQYGVGIVALGLLAYALKLTFDSLRQFRVSFDKNTEAIHQLTNIMEKQSTREHIVMEHISLVVNDTNQRVRRMEERL